MQEDKLIILFVQIGSWIVKYRYKKAMRADWRAVISDVFSWRSDSNTQRFVFHVLCFSFRR